MNEQEIRAAAFTAAAIAFAGRYNTTNSLIAAAEKIADYIRGPEPEEQSTQLGGEV